MVCKCFFFLSPVDDRTDPNNMCARSRHMPGSAGDCLRHFVTGMLQQIISLPTLYHLRASPPSYVVGFYKSRKIRERDISESLIKIQ